MGRPLISIIVPTYNVEKYVEKCIKSLIGQTLSNIEIILVDDGSTDSSGELCNQFANIDKRIKVIHQTNRGLGLSRNSGIEVATGDYIGFVDSDDFVSTKMFETLYNNAKKYNADISYCTYSKFETETSIIDCDTSAPEVKKWKGEGAIRQYLLDRIGLPPQFLHDNLYGASVCCGIFKNWIFTELGARFVSERKFIAEDMIFDIDVITNCKCIVHQDIPLYFYRYNPVSLTTVYKPGRFMKNVELYHEMYRRLELVYNKEQLFNSMSRYLLTTARIAVIQEARFSGVNGNKEAIQRINSICDNSDVQEVLSKYNYRLLPLKYRITCFFEKYKLPRLLFLLYKIKF